MGGQTAYVHALDLRFFEVVDSRIRAEMPQLYEPPRQVVGQTRSVPTAAYRAHLFEGESAVTKAVSQEVPPGGVDRFFVELTPIEQPFAFKVEAALTYNATQTIPLGVLESPVLNYPVTESDGTGLEIKLTELLRQSSQPWDDDELTRLRAIGRGPDTPRLKWRQAR